MPPRRFSRYSFAVAVKDSQGALVLHGAKPFRFRHFPDTREHVVQEGDTLQSLAFKYFQGMPRPAGLWWIIADFQPDPIHDPTVRLAVGRMLYIPSLRTVQEEIFSDKRRKEG